MSEPVPMTDGPLNQPIGTVRAGSAHHPGVTRVTLHDTTPAQDVAHDDAPASVPASLPTAPRASSEIDASAQIVTMITVEGARVGYEAGTLPDAVRQHLMLIGLRHVLSTSADAAKAYAGLKVGTPPGRAPAKPKDLDPWRKAYALALVEHTRKSDAPVTIETATDRARGLDKVGLSKAKVNALVVKHYVKLTGASAELV